MRQFHDWQQTINWRKRMYLTIVSECARIAQVRLGFGHLFVYNIFVLF